MQTHQKVRTKCKIARSVQPYNHLLLRLVVSIQYVEPFRNVELQTIPCNK